jgi:hypothetical protein
MILNLQTKSPLINPLHPQPCRLAKVRCEGMRPCSRCLRKNQAQYCIDAPATPTAEHGPSEAFVAYSNHEDPRHPPHPDSTGTPMPFPFAHVLGGPTAMPHGPLEPRKRRRTVIDRACTACRRSKKKCDGALPCSRCAAVRRETCSYAPDPAAAAFAALPRPRVCECACVRSCMCFSTPRDRTAGAPPPPPPPFTAAPQRCDAAATLPATAPLAAAGRGGGDGDNGAALAALLPFAEVGWRPADAARWLAGLPAALRGALREAGAVARLAASFDALERSPFAVPDATGPLNHAINLGFGGSADTGQGSDEDAGEAAARAYEGHPTVGVFWTRCGGGGGGAMTDAAGGGGSAGRYANERFAAMLGLERQEL